CPCPSSACWRTWPSPDVYLAAIDLGQLLASDEDMTGTHMHHFLGLEVIDARAHLVDLADLTVAALRRDTKPARHQLHGLPHKTRHGRAADELGADETQHAGEPVHHVEARAQLVRKH